MGALPQPPLIPQAPQNTLPPSPGPFQGYNAPGTAAQSTPPNTGANLVQGISAFVQQFQAQKEQERQHFASVAQQSLQNMMLGLPIDMKKTARAMERSGMNIDFKTPIAPPQGQPDANGVPPAPSVPPSIASAQPPPPNFWDRVKQSLGVSAPPINPNSVGMNALQNLQQQGQQRARIAQNATNLTETGQAIDAKTQALMQSALSGDQTAQELLARGGQMKELSGDDLFRMGRKAGIPENQVAIAALGSMIGPNKLMQFQLEQAEKMKENFGGDLSRAMKYVSDVYNTGTSTLQPDSMTVDQRLKIANSASEIRKQYPTIPLNVANTYALMEVTPGMEKQQAALADSIAKTYPTEASISEKRWTGQMNLDWQKLGEQMRHDKQDESLQLMNAVRTQLGSQFDEAFKILLDKQATGPQQDLATNMVVDAANKMKDIKIGGVSLGPGSITTKTVHEWRNLLPGGDLNKLEFDNSGSDNAIQQALQESMNPPDWVLPDQRKAWIDEHSKRAAELMKQMQDAQAKKAAASAAVGKIPAPTPGGFPVGPLPIPAWLTNPTK